MPAFILPVDIIIRGILVVDAVIDDDRLGGGRGGAGHRCIWRGIPPAIAGTGPGMRTGASNDGGPVLRNQPTRASVGLLVTRSGWTLDIAHRPWGMATMAHTDVNILVVVVVITHCYGLSASAGPKT